MPRFRVVNGLHSPRVPILGEDGQQLKDREGNLLTEERVYGQGDIVETDEDLLLYNGPGMTPKFALEGQPVQFGPPEAQMQQGESLEHFHARITRLVEARRNEANVKATQPQTSPAGPRAVGSKVGEHRPGIPLQQPPQRREVPGATTYRSPDVPSNAGVNAPPAGLPPQGAAAGAPGAPGSGQQFTGAARGPDSGSTGATDAPQTQTTAKPSQQKNQGANTTRPKLGKSLEQMSDKELTDLAGAEEIDLKGCKTKEEKLAKIKDEW